MTSDVSRRGHGRRWVYLVLVLPFIAMLWVPSYDSAEPALGGVPFFYWYQLLWVLLTPLFTLGAYAVIKKARSVR